MKENSKEHFLYTNGSQVSEKTEKVIMVIKLIKVIGEKPITTITQLLNTIIFFRKVKLFQYNQAFVSDGTDNFQTLINSCYAENKNPFFQSRRDSGLLNSNNYCEIPHSVPLKSA